MYIKIYEFTCVNITQSSIYVYECNIIYIYQLQHVLRESSRIHRKHLRVCDVRVLQQSKEDTRAAIRSKAYQRRDEASFHSLDLSLSLASLKRRLFNDTTVFYSSLSLSTSIRTAILCRSTRARYSSFVLGCHVP